MPKSKAATTPTRASSTSHRNNYVLSTELALLLAALRLLRAVVLAGLSSGRFARVLAASRDTAVQLRLAARRVLGFDEVLVRVVAGNADGDEEHERAQGAAAMPALHD